LVRLDIPVKYVERYLPLDDIQDVLELPEFEEPLSCKNMFNENGSPLTGIAYRIIAKGKGGRKS